MEPDSSNVSTERLYSRLSKNLDRVKCKVMEAGKSALLSHAAAKNLKEVKRPGTQCYTSRAIAHRLQNLA
jgi:hypothetical protein